MDMELWKEIKEYEGLYKISNYGRVKNIKTGRILLPSFNGEYKTIGLCKNKKRNYMVIHRLIAMAFIPNPNNLPYVNHKDENKLNNDINNLEWCTHTYNLTYGNAQKRRVSTRVIPVVQKTKSGEIIKIYKSRIEAEKETGIAHESISMCCNGKLKSAGGYIWENTKEK